MSYDSWKTTEPTDERDARDCEDWCRECGAGADMECQCEDEELAIYGGVAVAVVERRTVTGGTAVVVEKPRAARNWPWTISRFTVAESELKKVCEGA